MPLTINQWSEQNLMNSLKDYINQYIVIPYNNAVANTSYSSPLGIMLEKPSDPQQTPVFPVIVLGYSIDSVGPRSTGIGDGTVWYFESFPIKCYPALDSSNSPIALAAATFRNYIKSALGTALFIPINDYTQDPVVMVEELQVMNIRLTKPMGRDDLILASDRYRFDYMLDCRYSVVAING